jgi:hypothetical protein
MIKLEIIIVAVKLDSCTFYVRFWIWLFFFAQIISPFQPNWLFNNFIQGCSYCTEKLSQNAYKNYLTHENSLLYWFGCMPIPDSLNFIIIHFDTV